MWGEQNEGTASCQGGSKSMNSPDKTGISGNKGTRRVKIGDMSPSWTKKGGMDGGKKLGGYLKETSKLDPEYENRGFRSWGGVT